MSASVCSAEPDSLIRYSQVTTELDHALRLSSHHLRSTLVQFERRCTEQGMRLASMQPADNLERYAGDFEGLDHWVGEVGRRFQFADGSASLGSPGPAQAWLSPTGAVAGAPWPSAMRTILAIPEWLRELISRRAWMGERQVLGVASVYAAEPDKAVAISPVSAQGLDTSRLSRRELEGQVRAWTERLTSLRREIERLRSLGASNDSSASEIEQQIAKLRRSQSELQVQLEDWRNKVMLSAQGLRLGFDDGLLDAPWRTRADDAEDELKRIQGQIDNLEEQLQAQRQYEAAGVQLDIAATEKQAYETALLQHWWHDVPLYSQQGLTFGATPTAFGCTPTAATMVLAYWHEGDSSFRTLSPQELLDLNTEQKEFSATGTSSTNVHDDVRSLGYTVTQDYPNSDFGALQEQVERGPVVAIVKLGMGPTGTPHAVVVTGISPDGTRVRINDPWTGQSATYSREQFESTWGSSFGDGVSTRNFTVIRP